MDHLKLRKAMKARKPNFLRQDAHKVKRLPQKWRRPKGLHSKMRHKFKGYRALVSKGYKSPASVRGLSAKGLEMVTVANKAQLQTLNPKKQAVILASSVGMRKRLELVELANSMGIAVMNIPNQKDYRKVVEETLKQRKAEKKAAVVQAKPEDKKQVAKETKPTQDIDVKGQKDTEKKELDKVLTKQEK